MNNMRELLSIMQKYGDVATRISRNQFLLMVPELENEDIYKVTADIDKKYALRYSKEDVEISYIYKEQDRLQPVLYYVFSLMIMMLGSKAFDPSDTGLLCTACSRNPHKHS